MFVLHYINMFIVPSLKKFLPPPHHETISFIHSHSHPCEYVMWHYLLFLWPDVSLQFRFWLFVFTWTPGTLDLFSNTWCLPSSTFYLPKENRQGKRRRDVGRPRFILHVLSLQNKQIKKNQVRSPRLWPVSCRLNMAC